MIHLKAALEISYWWTAGDEIDSESWIIDEVNILCFRPLDRYSLKFKQPVPNSSAEESNIIVKFLRFFFFLALTKIYI